VLFIDLDNFKPVNDQHGHFEGDNILIAVAKRLQDNMRKVDTLSRMGGDEFIALVDVADNSQAQAVAEKLTRCIEQPFVLKEVNINLSASIGISLFPSDSRTAEQLLQNADEAMYHAKSTPLHSFSFYADI
jgi:diguanylate cyclase (GGDEF)-like protein